MRTSATGTDQAGFTLVEMLVAVAILGLLSGVIVMNLPDANGRLGDEADAFAARLQRAQEEAILVNRPVEVVVDASGYRFRSQRRGEWTALTERPFTPAYWGEGVGVQVRSADGRSGVRFDTTGAATPTEVRLRRRERRVTIAVDGQGQVKIHAPAG
ncbi:MAG: GspH/FimT family pseudopilin [Phenylobacterium sp.]|uniref:GspH/FimT family pseudopilin n=1 Tax=Phenylobacterium sp. TaxID=1871053 RepID=UPI002A36D177|nr:GspH/FimT family pseudopilin [Phenylobacterium sp.]